MFNAAFLFRQKYWRWESYCKRCGKCCYEKHRYRGTIFFDYSAPCRYLDVATKDCTIYSRRFNVNRFCKKVTIFQALFSPYLPEDCGYVERFRKFRYFSKERGSRL